MFAQMKRNRRSFDEDGPTLEMKANIKEEKIGFIIAMVIILSACAVVGYFLIR